MDYVIKGSFNLLYSQGKGTFKYNTSRYEKYEYGYFGGLYIKSNLYERFLNWENFVQIVLTLASDRAVLYGNVAFSILALLIKK